MRARSDLGLCVPEIHLFHSRKKLKRYLDAKRYKADLYDTGAQMLYLDGIVVVLMEHVGIPESEDALLVHEAYHAAVAHMDWLGEDKFGEESMAYLIQEISHALIVAHHKWRRRHVPPHE